MRAGDISGERSQSGKRAFWFFYSYDPSVRNKEKKVEGDGVRQSRRVRGMWRKEVRPERRKRNGLKEKP